MLKYVLCDTKHDSLPKDVELCIKRNIHQSIHDSYITIDLALENNTVQPCDERSHSLWLTDGSTLSSHDISYVNQYILSIIQQ